MKFLGLAICLGTLIGAAGFHRVVARINLSCNHFTSTFRMILMGRRAPFIWVFHPALPS